jgi:osmotically inducible protein OsmC
MGSLPTVEDIAMPTTLDSVLYTAHTTTCGGRNGQGVSDDGQLDVPLSLPGSNKPGTNPEQLFAVGYSACFIGAIGLAAKKLSIPLPANIVINASVSLGQSGADHHFALAVTLHVKLPTVSAVDRQLLLDTAHATCPYSRAIAGNIAVTLTSEG